MRRTFIFLLLYVPAHAFAASDTVEGRWEGPIRIPGRELQVVMDLARDGAGTWAGSIIVPGLGIKGAPLSNIVVTGADMTFDLGTTLSSPTYGPAAFKAHLTGVDAMAGDMGQGGNTAKFSFKRTAPAQVELPTRSTSVATDIADQWTGEFELGGYPRRVTITLENHAGAAATAQFVIVGKQTNDLPVDLVTEDGDVLRIESQASRVAFEGRFLKESGEIRGIVELGSLEVPLVLRRAIGRAS